MAYVAMVVRPPQSERGRVSVINDDRRDHPNPPAQQIRHRRKVCILPLMEGVHQQADALCRS